MFMKPCFVKTDCVCGPYTVHDYIPEIFTDVNEVSLKDCSAKNKVDPLGGNSLIWHSILLVKNNGFELDGGSNSITVQLKAGMLGRLISTVSMS